MNEHDLDARLRAKYRSRSAAAAPPTLARRVLAIPAISPRRRGWLPRFPHGGTTLMFSATKAVAAVAVLAVGGYLLVGVETPSADDPALAVEWAEADVGPRVMDGSVTLLEEQALAGDDAVNIGPNLFEWTTTPARMKWESSDPRLSGTGHVTEHGVQHTQSYTGLRSELWTIENADGSWSGTGDSFTSPRGSRGFITLTGTGGYDGLTAYLAVDVVDDEDPDTHLETRSFEGVVVPEPPPSLPNE